MHTSFREESDRLTHTEFGLKKDQILATSNLEISNVSIFPEIFVNDSLNLIINNFNKPNMYVFQILKSILNLQDMTKIETYVLLCVRPLEFLFVKKMYT